MVSLTPNYLTRNGVQKMIKFICHYITTPDSNGNIKEGDVHLYARDDAECRDILNALNMSAGYTSIRAVSRCPQLV